MSSDLPSVPEQEVLQSDATPPATTERGPEHDPTAEPTAEFSPMLANLSAMSLATLTVPPTPDQCLAHLKLLEAFHRLRENIATTNGLYGIHDRFVKDVYPDKVSDKERAQLLLQLRQKRWAIYVTNAERRYAVWFESLPARSHSMPSQLTLGKICGLFEKTSNKLGFKFDYTTLPPLDVLMVWHTHLLNPRDYLEDCTRRDRSLLWETGLPLYTIVSCIDNETFEYRTGDPTPNAFYKTTGLNWNSLDDDQQSTIDCAKCGLAIQTVLTTLTTAGSWKQLNHRDRGSGIVDPGFVMRCAQCITTTTHETRRVRKFQSDRRALLERDLPMPGTLLNSKGRLQPILEPRSHPLFFPNRLLKSFRSSLFEQLDKPGTSMNDVRRIMEHGIQGRLEQCRPEEKFAMRKMMSRYWSNASSFALDLVAAVIRQGTFIEKMHAIDWLHSPAVQFTMERLPTKYDRFFDILALKNRHIAVPTLDVDLVWHTHQLNPVSYYEYSLMKTDQFIDHDDKIPAPTLSSAFEWTSKKYQSKFGEIYSECTCWYCEAVREAHTSRFSRYIWERSTREKIESQLSTLDYAATENQKPKPHISAHNAIDCPGDSAIVAATRAKKQKLDAMYKKACKRAEKKSSRDHMPDRRDERSSAAITKGIEPIYLPYYLPYSADPCITADMYPSNPACASFQVGAMGNCCQGTCGGGDGSGGFGGCGGGGGVGGGGGGDGGGGGGGG